MAQASKRQDEIFEAGASRRAEQVDAYFANSKSPERVEQLRRADFRRYLDAVDRVFAAADAFRERRKSPTADAEFTAQMRAMKPRQRSKQEA